MKRSVLYGLVLACVISSGIANAQDLTESDTTYLRKASAQAILVNNRRPGFWDSLVADARKVGSPVYERMILSTAASRLMVEPNEQKALRYNEEAFAKAKEDGDKRVQMVCYRTWARFYCYMRNNATKAVDYSFKGLRLAEELGDEVYQNHFWIVAATSYFSARQYQKALSMHLRCLEYARKQGNVITIMSCLSDVGSDYHAMNQYPKASEYYLELKKYLPLVGEDPNLSEIFTTISSGHFGLQQYDSALKYAELAIAEARRTNNPRGIGSAMVALEAVSIARGEFAQAEKIIREALDVIQPVHAPMLTKLLAVNLEEACLKQGNYKGALEAYKLQVMLKDSLSDENKRKQLLELEFNYNLEKKESENRLLALRLRQNKYLLILVSLLAICVAVAVYFYYRQKKLRNEQESDRLSQRLLLSQMNPHFIFNSLQAIQSFVSNNDTRESMRYLGAFASVTRHVLENSRNEAIPLEEEIDLLRNYLDLQKLRFRKRFDYVIQVEEGVRFLSIHIPPMLLQPFIENAVEHGMRDVADDGRIEIRYWVEADFFFMEISDNGYGMTKSGGYGQSHRSLAMAITRERIALMNKREKTKTSFMMQDAFPGDVARKGVRVRFRFSLRELKRARGS